ncbi:hypothetical protein AMBLS11_12875 [Alteromonas macleodii str. 'Black Sea 11']|nr:hypothetical protein AMBLS11_12875 [Alteromonas macleodii str. 'Black Sea 11']
MLGAHLGKLNDASRALPKTRSATKKKHTLYAALLGAHLGKLNHASRALPNLTFLCVKSAFSQISSVVKSAQILISLSLSLKTYSNRWFLHHIQQLEGHPSKVKGSSYSWQKLTY